MHVTLGYLAAKPRDFKICLNCGAFNWYENDSCIICGSKSFRKATRRDIEEYVSYRQQHYEHCCDECEIDV